MSRVSVHVVHKISLGEPGIDINQIDLYTQISATILNSYEGNTIDYNGI